MRTCSRVRPSTSPQAWQLPSSSLSSAPLSVVSSLRFHASTSKEREVSHGSTGTGCPGGTGRSRHPGKTTVRVGIGGTLCCGGSRADLCPLPLLLDLDYFDQARCGN